MNLLLLQPHHFVSPDRALLCDRQRQHLLQVHKARIGDQIRVGELNGKIGNGLITHLDSDRIELSLELDQSPPNPLPLSLLIALPRPKMLKRILQTVATMGVKQLTFINSYRVEKSYWQSPLLQPDAIREQLILGLEQGVDTQLPEVRLVKRFKPFVEDELPQLCQGKRALVAHPRRAQPCPAPSNEESLLAIGPEGGFIDYEIDKLMDAGCDCIHVGERILRVETAVPVLLAKLFP